MKTVTFEKGIILFNNMSTDEAMAFCKKWSDAIKRCDSLLWSDVVVLGELPNLALDEQG